MSDTERRPGRLRKLRITRIDRVGSGANPDAHVLLYKNAEQGPTLDGGDVIDYSRVDPSVDTEPTERTQPMVDTTDETVTDTETLTDDAVAKANAERDEAVARAEAAEAALAAAVAPEAAADDDVVLKSADPAVRERIAKAEADLAAAAERIAKMEDEASSREFVAKAAEYSTVEKDADVLGMALKDVAKHCDPATQETISRVLKSATARLDEAHRLITAEIGTSGALDMTDAGQQIEALAKARASETGESMPVATAAVLNENPDLYEQARAQRV